MKRTGIILAGGKGSRLNFQEKGLIKIRNKASISYVIDALHPHVSDIIIIANNEVYMEFGYEVFSDIIQDFGPLSGIYTGLFHSKTDENFIVACDLPLLKESFFSIFDTEINNYDAIIPVSDGFTHVLTAFYHKRILSHLDFSIKNKQHKIRQILKEFNTKIVDLDQNGDNIRKEMLFNMNTIKDVEHIEKRLRS